MSDLIKSDLFYQKNMAEYNNMDSKFQ